MRTIMVHTMNDIKDTDFESQVIEASKTKPVIVDFHATWCGPCKQLKPALETLAAETGDAAHFFAADVDQAVKAVELYSIMGVPTVIVFKDGKPAERFSGFSSAVVDGIKAAI